MSAIAPTAEITAKWRFMMKKTTFKPFPPDVVRCVAVRDSDGKVINFDWNFRTESIEDAARRAGVPRICPIAKNVCKVCQSDKVYQSGLCAVCAGLWPRS